MLYICTHLYSIYLNNMINVSEIGKRQVETLMQEDGVDPKPDLVRVGVKSGGCSGLSYELKFDKTKPNGTLRKVLNINLAKKYGWVAKTDIKKAIKITYKDYLAKSS